MDFTDLAWTKREIVLDEVTRGVIIKILRYRVAYGRGAKIVSGNRKATLSPGEWRMECAELTCAVSVPKSQAMALADALAGARHGTVVTRPQGLHFRIDPTD